MTKTEALAAIHAATDGDIYDTYWQGGTWMVEAVETYETIDHFVSASAGYTECSRLDRGVIAGMSCISFARVQVRRGATRQPLSVIDLGEMRVAVHAELSDYFQ